MEAEYGSSKHLGRNNLPVPEFSEKKFQEPPGKVGKPPERPRMDSEWYEFQRPGFSNKNAKRRKKAWRKRAERLMEHFGRGVEPGWTICSKCKGVGVLPDDLNFDKHGLSLKESRSIADSIFEREKEEMDKSLSKEEQKRLELSFGPTSGDFVVCPECKKLLVCIFEELRDGAWAGESIEFNFADGKTYQQSTFTRETTS